MTIDEIKKQNKELMEWVKRPEEEKRFEEREMIKTWYDTHLRLKRILARQYKDAVELGNFAQTEISKSGLQDLKDDYDHVTERFSL